MDRRWFLRRWAICLLMAVVSLVSFPVSSGAQAEVADATFDGFGEALEGVRVALGIPGMAAIATVVTLFS